MMAGRPPMWDNAEAFAEAVDKYFDGNESPTWTGLALHLGFESRKSLHDYSLKPEFSYSVKKALLRIENEYEKNISSKNPTGAIFALKNFGWKDKQEIEQSGGIKIKFENPGDYVYPSQDQSNTGEPEGL